LCSGRWIDKTVMISRYQTALGEEGEKQPGSHGRVDRNLLGITSKREMDRIEMESLRRCEEYFAGIITTQTAFDLNLIIDIHRCIFGKIYSWAGKFRTVNLTKGDFTWPPPQYIETSLKEFEQKKLRLLTPIAPEPFENIPKALAEVHADFLMIHPFRDGNGRIARSIANLMALQASQGPPHYGLTGKGSRKQKQRYLNAVRQGYIENYEPLRRFFADALAGRIE